jgi:CRISPR/Cas system CSM-associated protein Csm3 (group 7 of RAMP superfamily)
MANEGNAQGIDDLLDDIPAGEEVVEEVEQPAEETPEQQETTDTETTETVEETESQVAKLFEQPKEHLQQTAPVSEVVKQRKLKQEAIARAEAAEAKLANQQSIDTQPLDELISIADGDDDEVIEKKDLRKLVEKLPGTIAAIAQQTTNKALSNAQIQSMATKAGADEAAFRKDHPDYDAKVKVAIRQKLLTEDDLKEVAASGNIAEAMYNKSKAAIDELAAAMGMTPSKPTTENVQQPTETTDTVDGEAPLEDDDAFAMFMGGGEVVS